jgi:S-disulfanyl-L-cysteine oxidoreductase SoxD
MSRVAAVIFCLLWVISGCTSRVATVAPALDVVDARTREPERFAIGRAPTSEEVAAWNIDIMPDGEGLPAGSGSVEIGRTLYAAQCQDCHGLNGRGGPFDALAGRLPGDGFPFSEDPRVVHTIGNYWPYATTLFDYTRRAMPHDRPGSLSDVEVYSLTAYLLFLNDLLDANAVLDRESLPKVIMPSRGRFVPDDRRGGAVIR